MINFRESIKWSLGHICTSAEGQPSPLESGPFKYPVAPSPATKLATTFYATVFYGNDGIHC